MTPERPAPRDPRLMCGSCGEMGSFERANGNIAVARYCDDGRLCCCTSASKTEEEALEKWGRLTNCGDEGAVVVRRGDEG